MHTLQGKVAVITGASGIGLAAARRLVGEGAYVFVMGSRQTEVEVAVKAIGNNVTGVRADTTNLDDLTRFYAVVERQKGKIDIVFAYVPRDRTSEMGVQGVSLGVQAALPLLVDGACIIVATSTAAGPLLPPCAVTNAALRSLAGDWSADLSPRGIRVNVVNPDAGDANGRRLERLASSTGAGPAPQLRFEERSDAEAVAQAVALLADDDGPAFNGVELVVDGGDDETERRWSPVRLATGVAERPRAPRTPARARMTVAHTGGSRS